MLIVPQHLPDKAQPSLGKRAIASAIDYALIFGLTFVYILYFGERDFQGGYTVTGWKALVVPLVWFLYFVVAEAKFGQTLGHALFDIKVVRIDEKPLRMRDSFLRHVLDPLDLFPFGIPAIIAATSNKNSQRLGDMLAETKVILSR